MDTTWRAFFRVLASTVFALFGVNVLIVPVACTQDAGSTADEAADPAVAPVVQTIFPHPSEARYWVSGQANFIFQTHPPFYALYSGTNSLQPNYEKATSRVLTLYTGYQITKSIEVLLDVEEAAPLKGYFPFVFDDCIRDYAHSHAHADSIHVSQSGTLKAGEIQIPS